MWKTSIWFWIGVLLLMHRCFTECSDAVTKRVCQNSVLHLDCGPDRQIVVKSATFGRTQRFTEECGYQSTSRCSGREAVHLVAGECALRPSCAVSATTSRFGNPCPGIWKYLQVQYSCTTASSVQSLCEVGEVLTLDPGDHGYLTSPGYPDTYPSRPLTCTTQLQAPFGTSVHLTVLHTNLPDRPLFHKKCSHYLNLTDSQSLEVTPLCRDSDQPVSRSFRNATVAFGTDGNGDFGMEIDIMAKGFILEYEVTGCPLSRLTIPELARLVDFRYGVSAEVMCDEGFRFRQGMSGRCECTGNTWVCDQPLHCEPIPCDLHAFTTPDHAASSVVDEGRTVTFRCELGFVPATSQLGELVCDKGQWSGHVGQCTEAECSLSSISVPAHMKVALGADVRSAHFRCRYGYKPAGGALGQLRCERGGWTGNIGQCVEADQDTSCMCHQVAFSVHLSPSVVMVTAHRPVPHDVITLNDAEAYVTHQHLFEAPLDGVYVFTWTLRGVLSNTELWVVKGGEVVAGGWLREDLQPLGDEDTAADGRGKKGMADGEQYGDTSSRMRRSSSGQVLLGLVEGDQVWLELGGERGDQGAVNFVTSQPASLPSVTFTGHLLYAT